MQLHRKTMAQVFFFGLVGVVSLLIDVGITKYLYSLLGMPAYLASAFGFLSGFLFNFPMNRSRVFRHTNKSRFVLRNQVIMFLSLSLFNLVFTSFFVDTLVRLNLLDIVYAKILATAIIATWNFTIFKWVIFSKSKSN